MTLQIQKSSTLVVYDADVIFRRSKSLQSPSSDAVSTKFPSLEKKMKTSIGGTKDYRVKIRVRIWICEELFLYLLFLFKCLYLDCAKSRMEAVCPEQSATTFPSLTSNRRTSPSSVAISISDVDPFLQVIFTTPLPIRSVWRETWIIKRKKNS